MIRFAGTFSKVSRWGAAVGLASSVVLLVVWSGCATPEERYRVLSFFFDGVPDPSTMIEPAEGTVVIGRGADARRVYAHKPWTEKDSCLVACHVGDIYNLPDSSICLKCHEETPTQFPRMHGPVAAVACLWCHEPHKSEHRYLLLEASPGLCIQCHEPGVLLGDDPPAHTDPARDCLDCHSGHGGDAAGFLIHKPDPEEAQPVLDQPYEEPDSEAPVAPADPDDAGES